MTILGPCTFQELDRERTGDYALTKNNSEDGPRFAVEAGWTLPIQLACICEGEDGGSRKVCE